MLTRKQKELLLFIHDSIGKEGLTPSFDEMREALRLRSKSGIHRLITGLEERGFIKRLPHRARALEILRMPDVEVSKTAKKAVKKAKDAMQEAGRSATSLLSLPVYGRIAAGTPIEAISTPHGEMDVPMSLLANVRGGISGEHYVLEVAGDSMIDAGIMEGDHVVIRRADTADNGAIVVALVDEGEATLKYFEQKRDEIVLKPANEKYEPKAFTKDRVRVQGRLVGLLRRY